jgi:hypothetical protein
MRLFRFFKSPTFFNRWTSDNRYDAEKLLRVFMPQSPNDCDDVSVFRAATFAEELENAVGWYTTTHPQKPDRVFAVVLASADLRRAGAVMARSPQSGPGIKVADERHYELSGTRDVFCRVLESSLRRIHSGREVVRFYTPSQVRLQLETFVMEPDGAFCKGARRRVISALRSIDLDSLRSRFDRRSGEVELIDGSSSRPIRVSRPTHAKGALRVVTWFRQLLRSG